MKWTAQEIESKCREASKRLRLTLPQAQLLLAQERFLERLMLSKHGPNFIWKGGSLLIRRYNTLAIPRFTIDIDFLVRGSSVVDTRKIFEEVVNVNLHDSFNFKNIQESDMVRETPYGGKRFDINWSFLNKQNSQALQVDVCAGDIVDSISIPDRDLFLIPSDTVAIQIYPAEFIFAEKLQTLAQYKTGNTRLKDFIDLWMLVQRGFDNKVLVDAIQRCFHNRKQNLDPNEWQRVLKDKTLIELFEAARTRNFSELDIPTMDQLFLELRLFLDQLLF